LALLFLLLTRGAKSASRKTDHHCGAHDERARNGDALALPARELSGIGVIEPLRQSDEVHEPLDLGAALLGAADAVTTSGAPMMAPMLRRGLSEE
jgi:hypothetical protein